MITDKELNEIMPITEIADDSDLETLIKVFRFFGGNEKGICWSCPESIRTAIKFVNEKYERKYVQ